MSNALFFLLALACPLMMVFMMRGMLGGHGHGGNRQDADASGEAAQQHESCGHGAHEDDSLDELKRRRDDLDREIAARENTDGELAEEQEQLPQPVA